MEYLFTFHNTHGALLAESVVLANQIPLKIMPLPSSLGSACGMCLRISAEDLERTKECLESSSVELNHIYAIHRNKGKRSYELWN